MKKNEARNSLLPYTGTSSYKTENIQTLNKIPSRCKNYSIPENSIQRVNTARARAVFKPVGETVDNKQQIRMKRDVRTQLCTRASESN